MVVKWSYSGCQAVAKRLLSGCYFVPCDWQVVASWLPLDCQLFETCLCVLPIETVSASTVEDTHHGQSTQGPAAGNPRHSPFLMNWTMLN
jgi:hypothetical protein